MSKILNKEALKAWILSKMVTLTNNLLANTPGISAMDAAQGPVIQGQIDEINSNLGGCSLEQEGNDFYITGADAVRKKLGDRKLMSFNYTLSGYSFENVPLPVDDAKIVMVKTSANSSGAAIDMVAKSVLFNSPSYLYLKYVNESTISVQVEHGSAIVIYYA